MLFLFRADLFSLLCRSFNDGKEWSDRLLALDPDAFHLDKVEAHVVRRRFVEPFDHLPMLLYGIGRNPDCNVRIQVYQIRENLPKMAVIGFLKLVLNDYFVSGPIFSVNIDSLGSDIAFNRLHRDI